MPESRFSHVARIGGGWPLDYATLDPIPTRARLFLGTDYLLRPTIPGPTSLPDDLITYATELDTALGPPRKKRRIGHHGDTLPGEGLDEGRPGLDYIVVKQSSLEIRCASSKLASFEAPLTKANLQPHIHWDERWKRNIIQIRWDSKNVICTLLPPKEGSEAADINIALAINQDGKRWSKDEGKIWTDFDLILSCKDGVDHITLVFTLKWATTSSPYTMSQASSKPPAFLRLLRAYFPDPNDVSTSSWSPQDFYQSVYHTDKNDGTAQSLATPELDTELYPFQKRAVQWLLQHEGVEWSVDAGKIQKIERKPLDGLPNSFISSVDANGVPFFVSTLFGLITRDVRPFLDVENGLRGGILAEEMGLGKTVETISLITLHKRRLETDTFIDPYLSEEVKPTSATLIITPPSILQQWISELNRHAPSLKVFRYDGIKAGGVSKAAEVVDSMMEADVVVTTYPIIAGEVHYTKLNPEKSLRRQPKYPRPKSPLMQLSWWRVCMDEAQMIESGVSNAALVARLIPRVNAWCITGTPVRKDVNDLLGLLIFLRYVPYATTKHVWLSLIQSHKIEFQKLFKKLALRHSKQSVKDELRLPAQRRYVITMPFTPIEEQHYQELFSRMCEEVGVDADGAPLVNNWNPNDPSTVEKMRSWLVRLRQTALHPEVGGRNRRALGYKDGPLRTVDQVLEAMMEQTDVAIRTDQRSLLLSKLKRGQFFENSPRVKEALAIWEEVCDEAHTLVEECRQQLRSEIIAESSGVKPDSSHESRNQSRQDTDNSEAEDE